MRIHTRPEIDLGTLVNFEEVVDVVAGLGGHDTRGRGRWGIKSIEEENGVLKIP